MDDFEKLRATIGPEAAAWTKPQLEQLDRDINAIAALLLDIYRSNKVERSERCGSPNLDVPPSER